MSFGFGFGLPNNVTAPAFSPSQLFALGEVGAWYDPSDFTTLFQDSAGTTPVTAVEQPVGLMLDKSKGLVLGSELVTNGDFSNGTTGWTGSASNIAVVNGRLQVSNTAAAQTAYQAISVVAGKTYFATANGFRVSGSAVYYFSFRVGPTLADAAIGQTNSNGYSSATQEPLSTWFTATTTGTVYIHIPVSGTGGSTTVSVDNISVKEAPGNHAFQATSANRPVLSARVNLLTATEDFSNSAWVANGGLTKTSNSITDPNASFCYASQGFTTVSGATYTASIELNASTSSVAFIQLTTGFPDTGVYFGLSGDGSYIKRATTATPLSASITKLADGWYRCTVSQLANASATAALNIAPAYRNDMTGGEPVASLTGAIYVRKADVRVSNVGVNLPAYQWVDTSTSYDTTGFPLYLKFNGTNSSLATNSINFSATDKMTVWAGVRKLSDAAAGVIAETGDPAATNGLFTLSSSGTNGTDRQSWGFAFRGTTQQVYRQPRTYSAPITNVISFAADAAAATTATQIIPKVNGASPGSIYDAAGPTSAGNFANQPLYIGYRNGVGAYFNGQLYSLIVRGAQSSASQITQTENWVNQRTGAY